MALSSRALPHATGRSRDGQRLAAEGVSSATAYEGVAVVDGSEAHALDPHVFAGNPLDRSDNERRDPEWLAACLADDRARYLPFRDLQVLVRHGSPAELAWLAPQRLDPDLRERAVLLGLQDGVPHLAVDVSALSAPALDALAAGEESAEFAEARGVAAALPAGDAGVLAQARSLLDWHARHGFCAACGNATVPRLDGGMRRCEACGAEHYPRVDPVVIVLVTRGEHALLASPRARAGTMYTCIAGFMEPGESIEEAVRREVLEEAGVRVGAVRYHSSQPWPFPSSLMLGCHADAASEEIAVDLDEIADAKWFERDVVARALAASSSGWDATSGGSLAIPPPMTISHQLIRAWALPGN